MEDVCISGCSFVWGGQACRLFHDYSIGPRSASPLLPWSWSTFNTSPAPVAHFYAVLIAHLLTGGRCLAPLTLLFTIRFSHGVLTTSLVYLRCTPLHPPTARQRLIALGLFRGLGLPTLFLAPLLHLLVPGELSLRPCIRPITLVTHTVLATSPLLETPMMHRVCPSTLPYFPLLSLYATGPVGVVPLDNVAFR